MAGLELTSEACPQGAGHILVYCPHCGELVDIQQTVERLMAAAAMNAAQQAGKAQWDHASTTAGDPRISTTTDPRFGRPL